MEKQFMFASPGSLRQPAGIACRSTIFSREGCAQTRFLARPQESRILVTGI